MISQNFFMHLRREFWESKSWLIGLPLLLALLIVLAVALLTQLTNSLQPDLSSSPFNNESNGLVLDFGEGAQPIDDSNVSSSSEDDEGGNVNFSIHSEDNLSGLSLLNMFLFFGWIGALCYLSTSLYSDRKDASILFWKSLPITDTEQVLSKLVFAIVTFPLVSLVIGWILLASLSLLDSTYYATNNMDLIRSLGDKSWLTAYVVSPLTIYGLGILKGIPVLTYTMLLSALAKRLPYLWLIIPLLAAALVERIVTNSHFISYWFITHFPMFDTDSLESLATNFSGFMMNYFARNAVDFVINISLGVVFVFASIWLRKNRFEI
jgi:ABC-2 type transport system permease protein